MNIREYAYTFSVGFVELVKFLIPIVIGIGIISGIVHLFGINALMIAFLTLALVFGIYSMGKMSITMKKYNEK